MKSILFLSGFFLFAAFAKDLLVEEESRSIEEAVQAVEKSQKDRENFNEEEEKLKREMASEKDPKFKKEFEKLLKDLD